MFSRHRNQAKASAGHRAMALFANFFLIILAYYQIKPASRSYFIEHLGADFLPYVWIGTAVCLGSLIGFYHRLVSRHSRFHVVIASCAGSIAVLVFFSMAMDTGGATTAVVFYIFVDIFSVMLVEQFWSLTNTVFTTSDGKRWFGFVAVGGLAGGVVGGLVANAVIEHLGFGTHQLPLVAAMFLCVITVTNLLMQKNKLFDELEFPRSRVITGNTLGALFHNRYVILIAAILLMSQLAQPLVEYQFIKTVEANFQVLDERTAYLAAFFAILGLVSIGINLLITPLVHCYLGVIAGLLVQPIMLGIASMTFMVQPTLMTAGIMKIADRGFSYSINRASREQLYIPLDPVQTYQVKAWIDMLGYRLFKVLGSVIILAMTQWQLVPGTLTTISWVTLACCLAWLYAIFRISNQYKAILPELVSK